ncbi:MAG: hypothetical protein WDA09_02100 [Bacteriovoracaceae bacterium]
MKWFWCLTFVSFNLLAQVEMLQSFDKKTYTPRQKSVTDLVVDIESEKMKEDLNEQKIFGNIKKLSFRFYWTAQPERLAVEVLGLPEGFKEVKENLKANTLSLFEDIIPIPLEKKFSNFKLNRKSNRLIEAKDNNSLTPISSYDLVFNNDNVLTEVIAKRAVGEMVTKFVYDKASFSDGRLVLKAQEIFIEESGQKVNIKKEISYQVVAGVGFPQIVNVTTKQTGNSGSFERAETLSFNNYQVNKGEALKFFLSENK